MAQTFRPTCSRGVIHLQIRIATAPDLLENVLLRGIDSGAVSESLNQVIPVIYAELHKIAEAYMRREREGHTLQPTALVNETYLRLLTQHSVDFENRAHVLGVAAQMMRRILATHAEKRKAEKRGGEFTIVCLDQSSEPVSSALVFSDVDDALKRMAAMDERQATVAELRILGGMTAEEIASFMDVSVATVHRDWSSGRLWLARELGGIALR